ncbi:hypothetical protein OOT33_09790 [Sphingobium sp. DEHP117]|uniref:hypothetical protein n=1 Tax=Sphingobium sp. DEHP117 TaxID=2993436 RepID=UPI0027D49E7D|nr:hypothetical protein [Sphingobium sp. DEHP117]MDQ4420722.1 hypothetical protein [Sphingobium sp. DEHP117]
MQEPLPDIEPELLKRLAGIEVASALEARKLASSEHSSSYNWLLASLLTINGGGLVALSTNQQLIGWEKVLIGVWFYVGLMAALLCAFFGQLANRDGIQLLGEQTGYWASVEHYQERSAGSEQEHETRLKKVRRKAMRARYSGFVSVAAFSVGLASLGYLLCQPSMSEKNVKSSVDATPNASSK